MKNTLAVGMQNENSASLYTLLLPTWTFSRKSGQGNHRSAADLWFPRTDFRESVQGGSKSVYSEADFSFCIPAAKEFFMGNF